MSESIPAAQSTGPAAMNQRGPKRAEYAPMWPEPRAIMKDTGRNAAPADVAENFAIVWREYVNTKPKPPNPA